MLSLHLAKGLVRTVPKNSGSLVRNAHTRRCFAAAPLSSLLVANNQKPHQTCDAPHVSALSPGSQRRFSSLGDFRMQPSYVVYGEECAFTIKAIPPQFRKFGANTYAIDAKNKGRMLLQWTPRKRVENPGYDWDSYIRLALSPEEAGLLVSRISSGNSCEVARRMPVSNDVEYDDIIAGPVEKVLHAEPSPDGSVAFQIDFISNGTGGQKPPTSLEAHGPLAILMTAGEYQVIKSIIEYSVPRLVGWSIALDNSIERSMIEADSLERSRGYHNSDVPF